MYRKKKQSFLIKAAVILLSILMISTSAIGLINRDVTIIVETDQPQYYPGETVYITGRILENGTGVPSSIYCVTIFDPDGNMTTGICGITDPQGNFSWDFTLLSDVILGTYEIFFEAHQFEINVTIYFEVVSTTIVVDAHGPYEGTAGESVSFYGDVTGGKTPYTWQWDFGDEQTSEEQNPDHIYAEAGEYIATLTVTDKGDYQGDDTAIVTINASENLPPNDPEIDGPASGKSGVSQTYDIVTTDPDTDNVKYVIEWGDDTSTTTEFSESGEEIQVTHTWDEDGTYIIRVKAIDVHLAESNWTTLEVSMPYIQSFENSRFKILNLFFEILQSLFHTLGT